MDCVKKTAAEGLGSFYKGTLSPLVGIGAAVAIQFATLETVKSVLSERRVAAGQGPTLSLAEVGVAGAVAGAVTSSVSTPVEHIRIRMQVQTGPGGQYAGTVDATQKIFGKHGLRGVYKGAGATLYREIIGYAGYFVTYEAVKRSLVGPGETASMMHILTAGAVAGFGMWIPAYPLDVVKSVLQTESMSNPPLRNTVGALRHIVATQGVGGLFRGFGPCMARAAPANAATFVAYEWALEKLNELP
jgi:solute carrier family 25 carnitine/acylcarnitine transporter 20/29